MSIDPWASTSRGSAGAPIMMTHNERAPQTSCESPIRHARQSLQPFIDHEGTFSP